MNSDIPKNQQTKKITGQSMILSGSLNGPANNQQDDRCQLLARPDLNDVPNQEEIKHRDKSGSDDQFQVNKANRGRNHFRLSDLKKRKREDCIQEPQPELGDGEIVFIKQKEPGQRKNKHPDLAYITRLRKDYKTQFGRETQFAANQRRHYKIKSKQKRGQQDRNFLKDNLFSSEPEDSFRESLCIIGLDPQESIQYSALKYMSTQNEEKSALANQKDNKKIVFSTESSRIVSPLLSGEQMKKQSHSSRFSLSCPARSSSSSEAFNRQDSQSQRGPAVESLVMGEQQIEQPIIRIRPLVGFVTERNISEKGSAKSGPSEHVSSAHLSQRIMVPRKFSSNTDIVEEHKVARSLSQQEHQSDDEEQFTYNFNQVQRIQSCLDTDASSFLTIDDSLIDKSQTDFSDPLQKKSQIGRIGNLSPYINQTIHYSSESKSPSEQQSVSSVGGCQTFKEQNAQHNQFQGFQQSFQKPQLNLTHQGSFGSASTPSFQQYQFGQQNFQMQQQMQPQMQQQMSQQMQPQMQPMQQQMQPQLPQLFEQSQLNALMQIPGMNLQALQQMCQLQNMIQVNQAQMISKDPKVNQSQMYGPLDQMMQRQQQQRQPFSQESSPMNEYSSNSFSSDVSLNSTPQFPLGSLSQQEIMPQMRNSGHKLEKQPQEYESSTIQSQCLAIVDLNESLASSLGNMKDNKRKNSVFCPTGSGLSIDADSQGKQVNVRTPRRGRSKSIVVPTTPQQYKNFPLSRLNNYDEQMKKHRGPLSMVSELSNVDENEEFNSNSMRASGIDSSAKRNTRSSKKKQRSQANYCGSSSGQYLSYLSSGTYSSQSINGGIVNGFFEPSMKFLNKRLNEKARQLSMMLNNSSDSEKKFTKKQKQKHVKSARVVKDKIEALCMFMKDYNSMDCNSLKAEQSVEVSYGDSERKSSASIKGTISSRKLGSINSDQKSESADKIAKPGKKNYVPGITCPIELAKIKQANMKGRSQSIAPKNAGTPLVEPSPVAKIYCKNFGHRERSNLAYKARQLQRSRAQSLAVDEAEVYNILDQIQGNSPQDNLQRKLNNIQKLPTIPTLELKGITQSNEEHKHVSKATKKQIDESRKTLFGKNSKHVFKSQNEIGQQSPVRNFSFISSSKETPQKVEMSSVSEEDPFDLLEFARLNQFSIDQMQNIMTSKTPKQALINPIQQQSKSSTFNSNYSFGALNSQAPQMQLMPEMQQMQQMQQQPRALPPHALQPEMPQLSQMESMTSQMPQMLNQEPKQKSAFQNYRFNNNPNMAQQQPQFNSHFDQNLQNQQPQMDLNNFNFQHMQQQAPFANNTNQTEQLMQLAQTLMMSGQNQEAMQIMNLLVQQPNTQPQQFFQQQQQQKQSFTPQNNMKQQSSFGNFKMQRDQDPKRK